MPSVRGNPFGQVVTQRPGWLFGPRASRPRLGRSKALSIGILGNCSMEGVPPRAPRLKALSQQYRHGFGVCLSESSRQAAAWARGLRRASVRASPVAQSEGTQSEGVLPSPP